MRHRILTLALGLALCTVAYADWKPAGDRIKTKWSQNVNPSNPLPEYPRPQMERNEWKSLNGLWNYAISPKGKRKPMRYDGDILVPFSIESSLSGVGKEVGKDNELWYQRKFSVPQTWKGKRIILNFEAVDWRADVWVNDIKVGSHEGGYAAFSMDITDALNDKGENILDVRVWDPSSDSYQPRGKQVTKPSGIWYTSVTGIWQSVWMEPVEKTHIDNIVINPDFDSRTMRVMADIKGDTEGVRLEMEMSDSERTFKTASLPGQPLEIVIYGNFMTWTPDNPNLYDITVKVKKNGREIDRIKSYAAMRKISLMKDDNGITRMALNNEPLFQYGPLDQGWWPDGLYTAPTDEALRYDIEMTKKMGFNMIRKHVKVEPRRWYAHCDRIGMLVWQDMPSGDRTPKWENKQYYEGEELHRTMESEACYRHEWQEIIDQHRSVPSIVVWVPFNEGWGQFKTKGITEWTKSMDPTRLVNPASGGNFFNTGDILDLHNYPAPDMYLYDATKATVLGEYGGIGWPVDGHLWEKDRNWGYVKFSNSDDVTKEYLKYAQSLYDYVKRGFSAAVYTQTTDVEIEVNGLMTYDRELIKVDIDKVSRMNKKICQSLEKPNPGMKTLKIKSLDIPVDDLSKVPAMFDEKGIEFTEITCANWPGRGTYKPDASFRLAKVGQGLLINFKVSELTVRAEAVDGGSIWADSCCEFFSAPTDDGWYYNLEANCTGNIYFSKRKDRWIFEYASKEVEKSIKRWSSLGSGNFKEKEAPKEWQMVLYMPFTAYFDHDIKDLKTFTANVYKAGGMIRNPHLLTWSPIYLPEAELHSPKFFGKIIVERY